MKNDEQLERHLELCKRVFEQMVRDGSWPWRDSQNSEDLVESGDNAEDI